MRIDRVLTPKSSFLSIEKDMSIIVRELLKNERLKRLLYYTTPDVLNNTEKCLFNYVSCGSYIITFKGDKLSASCRTCDNSHVFTSLDIITYGILSHFLRKKSTLFA